MRLTPEYVNQIKTATKNHFGSKAVVKLFGSRTNDALKGGDIDLLIECPSHTASLFQQSLRMNAELQCTLGEQRIDIIVAVKGQPQLPIHQQALANGIAL